MSKVFAVSDHHFFHRNIIKYCDRPFNVNDENCIVQNAEMMVKRHNEVVKCNDVVLMVGDLSANLKGREQVLKSILELMKGRKVLVRGNHDHLNDEFYLGAGFVAVTEYIVIGDYFICHYPCYKSEFNRKREPWLINQLEKTNCTKIIHGHVHQKDPSSWEPDGYTRTNVCVDFKPNNYYPQELTQPEIIEYVKQHYS